MKTIKLLVGGETLILQIVYECPQYIFAECNSKPEMRGFYTSDFIAKNKQ